MHNLGWFNNVLEDRASAFAAYLQDEQCKVRPAIVVNSLDFHPELAVELVEHSSAWMS